MNRFQRLCYQQAKLLVKLAQSNGHNPPLYAYYKSNLALNRYITIDEIRTKLVQSRAKHIST